MHKKPFRSRTGAAALWLAGLLVLASASCSEKTAPPLPPPLVEIMEVTARDIDWAPEFIGQTAGFLEVEVRARVGGILEERLFEEGQFVTRGTQLFQIDPVPCKIALERAEGALAQARARLERTRREHVRVAALFEEDAVSERERDDAEMAHQAAEADLQVARANLHDAQVKLEYTQVFAPISGIVRKESCSVGTLVATTTDASLLTTMVQVDPLYVDFSVPGADFALMRTLQDDGILSRPKGPQEVAIVLPDGSLHPSPGRVVFTDSAEDARTATVRSKVELPNPGTTLMPGQFVRVRFSGLQLKDVVCIPRQAIFTTQQGPSVYVVDQDMKVAIQPVTEKLAIGTRSIISAGLQGGEKIITAGMVKVRPGARVRAAAPAETPAGKGAP